LGQGRGGRHKTKIPETIAFQTKPEIALEQLKAARAAGLPQGVVLMDAGYGNDTRLRTEITAHGMSYAAGIGPNTSVWPLAAARLPPQPRSGRGRPQTRLQRDGEPQPISVKALALSLPQEARQTITWREGSADGLASRFCPAARAAGAS
jgi:SRSO17 transposase